MRHAIEALAHGLGDLLAGLLRHETWAMLGVQIGAAWLSGGG